MAILGKASTGSGKSVLMSLIVDSFLNMNKKFKLDRHLFFICDEKSLMYQFSKHLNKWNIPHDIIGDGQRQRKATHIHVCTIQTLAKYPPAEPPAMFIIDEAHLTTSPRWMEFFAKYPETKILGLTATDETSGGKGLSKKSGNGIFDVVVECDVTMRELTEGIEITDGSGVTTLETFLTPVKCFGVPIKGIENLHMRNGDVIDKEVEALLKANGTYGDAIKEMAKFPEIQDLILFFCKSLKSCVDMRDELLMNGYTAEILEGKLSKTQRRDIMNRFMSGQTQCMVSCRMFQKGRDVPQLKMGVDMQPTASRGLQRQKIGRGTRKHEGKLLFILLDMVANHRVFPGSDIYAEYESNFDSMKNNKKPIGTGEENVCPLCYALIPIGQTNCADCGAEKLKPKTKKDKHMDGDLVEIVPVPLKDRSEEDKTAVNKSISKAIVDNDIEALKEIGRTLTTKRNLPFWIYYKLRQNTNIIDVTLLFRIQRSMDFKSSWTHFAKKQIKCS
jgi:superfamily II DNA or RNA helicase/ribosomal protein L40E